MSRVAEKFRWLDQVAADPHLTRIGLHVALAISRWVQRNSGAGWRPQRLLAQDCRLTEQGLRKAIEQLRTRGHLEVSSGRGRGHANSYRLVLKSHENPNTRCPFNDEKPQHTLPFSDDKTATAVLENPNGEARKTATAVAPTPVSTPFSTPVREFTRKKTRPRATRLSDDWTLPEQWAEEALEKGMTREQLELSAARFRAFYTSGNGRHAKRVNWQTEWQSWYLGDLARPRASGTRPKSTSQTLGSVLEEYRSGSEEHDGPTLDLSAGVHR